MSHEQVRKDGTALAASWREVGLLCALWLTAGESDSQITGAGGATRSLGEIHRSARRRLGPRPLTGHRIGFMM
jgi:hypothetical protein